MNNEEYLKKISEYIEIEPTDFESMRGKRKLSLDTNDTLPIRMKSFLEQEYICPHCDRRSDTPYTFDYKRIGEEWYCRCSGCNRYQCKDTGVFSVAPITIAALVRRAAKG